MSDAEPLNTEDTASTAYGEDVQNEADAASLSLRQRRVRMAMILLVAAVFPLLVTQSIQMDMQYDCVCLNFGIPLGNECLESSRANKAVADYTMVSSMISSAGGIVVTPYLSELSDRRGRKPVITWCLAVLGLAVSSVYPVIYKLPPTFSIWRMVIPDIITAFGCLPMLSNMIILYVSDLLPEVKLRTSYLSFATGLSMAASAVGPALGGMLSGAYGFGLLNLWASMSAFAILVVFFFVVPESLSPSLRKESAREHSTGDQGATSEIRRMAGILWFTNAPDIATVINGRILFVTLLIGLEFNVGLEVIQYLYAKRQFGWKSDSVGTGMSVRASVSALWLLLLFPMLNDWLCKIWPTSSQEVDNVDVVLLKAAQVFSGVGYLLIAFAPTSTLFLLATGFSASSAFSAPVQTSALLKLVPSENRGEFMAARSVVLTTASAILPAIFAKMYSLTADVLPQFVFLLAGVLSCLLIGVYYGMRPYSPMGNVGAISIAT